MKGVTNQQSFASKR